MAKEEIEEAKVEEVKLEEVKPEPVPEPVEKPPVPEPAPITEQPIAVEKGEATKAQIEEIKSGRYYTIKQLASELGYSYGLIRSLVISGKIKAVKPTGGTWRIPPSEIERIKTEGIPPMPREKPEVEATEIVVEGKHVERVAPPEKEEAKETETVDLIGWLFKPEKKEE